MNWVLIGVVVITACALLFVVSCSDEMEDKTSDLLGSLGILVVLVSLVVFTSGSVTYYMSNGLKGELVSMKAIVPEMANISKCLDDYITLGDGNFMAQLESATDLASSAQKYMIVLFVITGVPSVFMILFVIGK